ncbi:unnamed protein product [Miscanthus lutarioriparius]|uniref:Uncharacterized protein n=1 Tax=Miscanthus lutarioriparius TaxID=422564 RepID=A0A811RCZ7_9POAL|nr:unnamed protein product [Miscanthus lutarioriparius]
MANIRAIAVDYGRRSASFLAPLVCPTLPPAPSAPPLMATVLVTNGAAATAGAEAATITDDHHGNTEKNVDRLHGRY